MMFGMILSALLERREVSQQGLSRMVDVDHSYISRLCRGERHPSFPVLLQIKEALVLTTEEWDQLALSAGFRPDPCFNHPAVSRLARALKRLDESGKAQLDHLVSLAICGAKNA